MRTTVSSEPRRGFHHAAAPKLRDPAAADRWTWLIVAADAQLRLARTLAEDLRLPWQRPALAAGSPRPGSAAERQAKTGIIIDILQRAEEWAAAEYLQAWLEGQDVSYVMAVRCSDTLSMIGYTLPESRRRLVSLIQRYARILMTSGPGHAGADDASTRPG